MRCPDRHGCIELSVRPGRYNRANHWSICPLYCGGVGVQRLPFVASRCRRALFGHEPWRAAPATSGLYSNPAAYPSLSSQTLLYPNGNYLGALSQSEQAAFQSGSFDIYAHPATVGYLPQYFASGGATTDIAIPYTGNGFYAYNGFNLTTSNNLGVNAGTANTMNSASGWVYTSGVTFTPDPHTVNAPQFNPYFPQAETSPGYLGTFANSSTYTYGQFYGMVAGINDHGNLALNEFTWPKTYSIGGGHRDPSPEHGKY